MDFKKGDFVIYLKNKTLEEWKHGFKRGDTCQKGIWQVTNIVNNMLNVRNLNTSASSFTSNSVNFKPVEYLEEAGMLSIPYILKDCLDAYYDRTKKAKKAKKAKKVKKIKLNKKGKMMDIMNDNVEAAKLAAKVTTGNVLNKALITKLRPQLPLMVRGYADTAIAEILVANIANFAVQNFAQDNEKAVFASDAMMQAAMVSFMSKFNIEKVLDELLSSVELSKVDSDAA